MDYPVLNVNLSKVLFAQVVYVTWTVKFSNMNLERTQNIPCHEQEFPGVKGFPHCTQKFYPKVQGI